MLGAITLLLLCQLAGEVLVRLVGLPVPGPVLGMVFLFLYLLVRRHVPEPVERASNTLLDHLSLLFVPAGVGVIRYAQQLEDAWLAIAVSLVAGTAISIGATAWIVQHLLPRTPAPKGDGR
ncbi:MAG: CidA/LrgA family protein [Rhodospirillaceae bacterium]